MNKTLLAIGVFAVLAGVFNIINGNTVTGFSALGSGLFCVSLSNTKAGDRS